MQTYPVLRAPRITSHSIGQEALSLYVVKVFCSTPGRTAEPCGRNAVRSHFSTVMTINIASEVCLPGLRGSDFSLFVQETITGKTPGAVGAPDKTPVFASIFIHGM